MAKGSANRTFGLVSQAATGIRWPIVIGGQSYIDNWQISVKSFLKISVSVSKNDIDRFLV